MFFFIVLAPGAVQIYHFILGDFFGYEFPEFWFHPSTDNPILRPAPCFSIKVLN